ncbi:uncharacterized protein TOT_010000408 [Theileria orientalis strain Shintoku]|uniref:Uncharacterized protein n=1 Tax=Theileria orientalis strain Shintoku TaxID=869250 RepID=J4C7F4_THEOR|nr:uncharacterized protein TOT_010000408 [Theileria orientalis strain Shintoku]BAM38943.1 uncharacterized protein TOT_010000408 [Theileria orientalis strain Shintoku]|eukprot:XP_009689244.1 uncharacterized protein TOT_010000408 [Theileria orientalis strain Shintoku]
MSEDLSTSAHTSINRADLRKLDTDIYNILTQFEKTREWADLTNCLIKLNRILSNSTIPCIPYKEIICKRLAQCLNHQLPTGVHTRALEVYASILDKTPPESLSRDLALFSTGLFPFFSYSSYSVRPQFLNIIDKYYIPLGPNLIPCLIGLLICIIPGLEDDKSETYDMVYNLLEKISKRVPEKYFMSALWLILKKANKIRLQTLYLISNKLSPRVPKLPAHRLESLLPDRNDLVLKSLMASTRDDSLIILRELMNFMSKHFPLDHDLFTYQNKSALCRSILRLLRNKDWSLTRRIYQWLFNTNDLNESVESIDLKYFNEHSKSVIITAIKELLKMEITTADEAVLPLKIIVTLISDIEVAVISDQLMPVLCIPILRYVCEGIDDTDWRQAVIQETKIIFNPTLTPPNIVFISIAEEFNKLFLDEKYDSVHAWNEILNLSRIYLDEMKTLTSCETILAGLFMLLENALYRLLKLELRDMTQVVSHLLSYVASILARTEKMILTDYHYFYFENDLDYVKETSELKLLVHEQELCNERIAKYLDEFYINALNHFESKADLNYTEISVLDMLNSLAVRFVSIEVNMQTVPITRSFSESLGHTSPERVAEYRGSAHRLDYAHASHSPLSVNSARSPQSAHSVQSVRSEKGDLSAATAQALSPGPAALVGKTERSTPPNSSTRKAPTAAHTTAQLVDHKSSPTSHTADQKTASATQKSDQKTTDQSLEGKHTHKKQTKLLDESDMATARSNNASSRTSAASIESKLQNEFKLDRWIVCLLKSCLSPDPVIFCRGISTFIQVIDIPHRHAVKEFFASSLIHLRNILTQLWSSLDDKLAQYHSEVVYIVLQLMKSLPQASGEAERIIVRDLTSTEIGQKINAILRFGVLFRHLHTHAPDKVFFSDAVGHILDAVEDSDPKVHYYARAFLSESIYMLPKLIDPILHFLITTSKMDESITEGTEYDVLPGSPNQNHNTPATSPNMDYNTSNRSPNMDYNTSNRSPNHDYNTPNRSPNRERNGHTHLKANMISKLLKSQKSQLKERSNVRRVGAHKSSDANSKDRTQSTDTHSTGQDSFDSEGEDKTNMTELVRKFRHLSSIVGREGQAILDLMNRRQAPIALLKLIQGDELFNELSTTMVVTEEGTLLTSATRTQAYDQAHSESVGGEDANPTLVNHLLDHTFGARAITLNSSVLETSDTESRRSRSVPVDASVEGGKSPGMRDHASIDSVHGPNVNRGDSRVVSPTSHASVTPPSQRANNSQLSTIAGMGKTGATFSFEQGRLTPHLGKGSFEEAPKERTVSVPRELGTQSFEGSSIDTGTESSRQSARRWGVEASKSAPHTPLLSSHHERRESSLYGGDADETYEHQNRAQKASIFPRLLDASNSSYTDASIYNYLDLVIVITLKYICIDADLERLLRVERIDDLLEYQRYLDRLDDQNCSTRKQTNILSLFNRSNSMVDLSMEDRAMLLRCTAIDFMKSFISSLQPANSAREVSCMVAKYLLLLLYHFHLKQEHIIQTQMIYLLKVVMDRCSQETTGPSAPASSLIELSRTLLSMWASKNEPMSARAGESPSSKLQITPNMLATSMSVITGTANILSCLTAEDDKQTNSLTSDAFFDKTAATTYVTQGIENLSYTRDPDTALSQLTPMYIINMGELKKLQIHRMTNLHEITYFPKIIEICIANSAKSKCLHLLQSYIDFSLYSLKFMSGAEGLKYASNFMTEFSSHVLTYTDKIGTTGLFYYLRALYFMFSHLSDDYATEATTAQSRKMKQLSINREIVMTREMNGTKQFGPKSDGGRTMFGSRSKRKTTADTSNLPHFDITSIVDSCVKSVLWARETQLSATYPQGAPEELRHSYSSASSTFDHGADGPNGPDGPDGPEGDIADIGSFTGSASASSSFFDGPMDPFGLRQGLGSAAEGEAQTQGAFGHHDATGKSRHKSHRHCPASMGYRSNFRFMGSNQGFDAMDLNAMNQSSAYIYERSYAYSSRNKLVCSEANLSLKVSLENITNQVIRLFRLLYLKLPYHFIKACIYIWDRSNCEHANYNIPYVDLSASNLENCPKQRQISRRVQTKHCLLMLLNNIPQVTTTSVLSLTLDMMETFCKSSEYRHAPGYQILNTHVREVSVSEFLYTVLVSEMAKRSDVEQTYLELQRWINLVLHFPKQPSVFLWLFCSVVRYEKATACNYAKVLTNIGRRLFSDLLMVVIYQACGLYAPKVCNWLAHKDYDTRPPVPLVVQLMNSAHYFGSSCFTETPPISPCSELATPRLSPPSKAARSPAADALESRLSVLSECVSLPGDLGTSVNLGVIDTGTVNTGNLGVVDSGNLGASGNTGNVNRGAANTGTANTGNVNRGNLGATASINSADGQADSATTELQKFAARYTADRQNDPQATGHQNSQSNAHIVTDDEYSTPNKPTTTTTNTSSLVTSRSQSLLGSELLRGIEGVMTPNRVVSVNALSLLIYLNYDVLQLNRRTPITNVFYQTFHKSLTSYILPLLVTRQHQQQRYFTLLLIRYFPYKLYQVPLLNIKKNLLEFINSSEFFRTDQFGLRELAHVFRRMATEDFKGVADTMARLDLYTNPPHLNVFSNKSASLITRVRYLKRLAFVLYACENDVFTDNISNIIERLAETTRSLKNDTLRSKCLFVMRVLLVKTSQEELTVLWPVLLSELIKVFRTTVDHAGREGRESAADGSGLSPRDYAQVPANAGGAAHTASPRDGDYHASNNANNSQNAQENASNSNNVNTSSSNNNNVSQNDNVNTSSSQNAQENASQNDNTRNNANTSSSNNANTSSSQNDNVNTSSSNNTSSSINENANNNENDTGASRCLMAHSDQNEDSICLNTRSLKNDMSRLSDKSTGRISKNSTSRTSLKSSSRFSTKMSEKEYIKIMENEECPAENRTALLIEAIKIVDMACALKLNEFLVYQWMFINDLNPIKRPSEKKSESKARGDKAASKESAKSQGKQESDEEGDDPELEHMNDFKPFLVLAGQACSEHIKCRIDHALSLPYEYTKPIKLVRTRSHQWDEKNVREVLCESIEKEMTDVVPKYDQNKPIIINQIYKTSKRFQ